MEAGDANLAAQVESRSAPRPMRSQNASRFAWYHMPMRVLAFMAAFVILIPAAELVILIQVGREIGILYTILIVFGAGIFGAVLARLEGLRIIGRMRADVRAGIMPTDKLFDGLLVLVAGVLLLVPGLLSDIAGLVLLFPLTRYPFKLLLQRMARQWVVANSLRISV